MYYKLFRRTELEAIGGRKPEELNEELKRRFEPSFTRIYGRRRYVLPLILLAFVAAVGLWGTAKTLQSWQGGVSGPFKFPPEVVGFSSVAVGAFLGAWTWVVYDQFSRLRNRDLTFHDMYGSVFRFLIALPFGFFLSKWATGEFGAPLAFLLGTFPTGTLFKIGRRLAVQQFKLGEDAGEASNELEKLQCVSRSSAERFMDEGINTIAELAWSDPVDLTLRTNKEFDYVIDCASQALVWVYFEDKTRDLYKLSLRTAHEVTSLVYSLQSSNLDQRTQANETLSEAAKTLGMESNALLNTLRQIEEDPFVQFLVAIWHWPAKEGS
ncbi:MAG TPA: hypothetical protein VFN26_15435 [Candidatus Acidoferrum sp.]|nr:hypothetical protein [Candidatus Acidoferrum sp.]